MGNNRGNHDNLLNCGEAGESASKALAAQVYSHFFNSTPYSSRDVGGWKIVALNSMYGGWMDGWVAAQHASMRDGGLASSMEVGCWCRLENKFWTRPDCHSLLTLHPTLPVLLLLPLCPAGHTWDAADPRCNDR